MKDKKTMQSLSKSRLHAIEIPERILSVDVFRGATIAAMLLVGYQGSYDASFPVFRHAEWSGWTFTDCIAPSFMWIVGLTMNISIDKRRRQGNTPLNLLLYLGRRALSLFLLGILLVQAPILIEVFLKGNFKFLLTLISTFTITGTLQRISIAFFIGGILSVFTIRLRYYIAASSTIIIGYSLLLLLVPVPGFGAGNFGVESNAITYLDQLLLGSHAGMGHPIVSALSASATVLLGSVVCKLLQANITPRKKLELLMSTGGVLLFGGWILQHWIPVIQRIWTPSFCLLMAGIATLTFASIYYLIDIMGIRKGIKPLLVLGMNPIAMWVIPDLIRLFLKTKGIYNEHNVWTPLWTVIYDRFFLPFANAEVSSLAVALLYTSLMYGIAYLMYSRKWIIRM